MSEAMSEALQPVQPLEALEIKLLLEAIYQRFGDDFRGYQLEHIRPQLHWFMQAHALDTVSGLQQLVLHEEGYIDALLNTLDAREPMLFESPKSLLKLRELLVPWLRSCPAPNMWIADCAAAEDIFALAILLCEENLLAKTRIYATNRSAHMLEKTRTGQVTFERLAHYQENYRLAGGTVALKHYFQLRNGEASFCDSLLAQVTWAQYDLATDASFNEFEAIVCIGGLARYATGLRRRALQIFSNSLPVFGVLALPGATTLKPAEVTAHFDIVSVQQGIYRKHR